MPVKKTTKTSPAAKPSPKPAIKPATKPVTRAAASGAAPEFPKKELDKWLKAHKTWNHEEWLELLKDLKAKGYGNLVGKKAGQNSVGLYLETHRKQ